LGRDLRRQSHDVRQCSTRRELARFETRRGRRCRGRSLGVDGNRRCRVAHRVRERR
jgi:hypothetical protein